MKQLGKQLNNEPFIPSVTESRGSKLSIAKPATEMGPELDVSSIMVSQRTSLRLTSILSSIYLWVFQVTIFRSIRRASNLS
jgi:hypothetical protein